MTLAGRAIGTKQGLDHARRLLAWYDRHRRALPWRAPPGHSTDPYRIWLSEIMLQQTTVKAVIPYYARFLQRFPSVEALAAAPLEAVLPLWAGLGYYARARHLHRCARLVAAQHGGAFPDGEDALRALPGIGDYTAAAIAAIAFDRPATAVDGNIARVVARLFAMAEPLPGGMAAIRARAGELTPNRRPGDYTQAMMDLGATVCTPRNPACRSCPLRVGCAALAQGDPERFPVKPKRAPSPVRRAAAFVVLRGEEILVRTREAKGLLGGMVEVPTSPLTADANAAGASALSHAPRLTGLSKAPVFERLPRPVRHVFTHFRLELTVYVARVPRSARARGMRFLRRAERDRAALPTVMRKVVAAALGDGAR